MRNFTDYVNDRRQNLLYHTAKQYAEPDFFMSFTEATWTTKNSNKVPNGITAFPVAETMHRWVDTPDGKRFELVSKRQDKLYILQSEQTGSDYTETDYQNDLKELEEFSNLTPNERLIQNYERLMEKRNDTKDYFSDAIHKERNRFSCLVKESTNGLVKPEEKLWQVTKWLAAGAKNPNESFTGNAPQRWTNILRRLGYDAFVMEEIALFLSTSAFEVVDEVRY